MRRVFASCDVIADGETGHVAAIVKDRCFVMPGARWHRIADVEHSPDCSACREDASCGRCGLLLKDSTMNHDCSWQPR